MNNKKILIISLLSFLYVVSFSCIMGSFAKYTTTLSDEINLTVVMPQYTVVYNANGGTGSMDNQEFEYGETKYLTSNTFTREHYSFIGWNTQPDGSGASYGNHQSVNNLTSIDGGIYNLYAQWESKATTYTVRHNKMDLDGINYSLELEEVINAEYGDIVTPPVNTYPGFTSPSTVTETVLKNGALIINYNYIRNQVVLTINNPEYVTTETPSGTYYYDRKITLTAIDRDGYNFDSWVSGETTNTITFNIIEDTTKEPSYSLIDYNIVYNLDDGIANNPPTYNINSETFTLNNPTKTKYVFVGWTGSNGDTPQETVTISQGSFGHKEYTANYNEITSTITISVTDEETMTETKTVTISQVLANIDESEVTLEYSLNGGETWTTYIEPFELTTNKTIMARTVQTVGEVLIGEASKEVTTIIKKIAELVDGPTFNVMMKAKAGDESPTTTSANDNIRSIRKFTGDFTEDIQNNADIISTPTSTYPVYMWYEQNTIYYYTDAETFMTNADSQYMFSKLTICDTIEMIAEFDTSNAVNMSHMFDGFEKMHTLDLTHFDTSNVTNMEAMFWTEDNMTTSINTIDVSSFDTSSVTNMKQMFYGVDVEELELTHFDTTNVTNMDQMFAHARKLRNIDLSSFNTSNVTSMYQMFYHNQSAQSITFGEDFDTSHVTNMESMFEGINTLNTLDLSKFNTSSVTNMKNMFYDMMNLQRIYVASDFDTTNVVDDTDMFYNNNSLTGGKGTRVMEVGVVDSTYAKIDRDKDTDPGYFTDIADKPTE